MKDLIQGRVDAVSFGGSAWIRLERGGIGFDAWRGIGVLRNNKKAQ